MSFLICVRFRIVTPGGEECFDRQSNTAAKSRCFDVRNT